MNTSNTAAAKLLPFATEASWATGRWAALEKYTSMATNDTKEDFNIRVGEAILALQKENHNKDEFTCIIKSIRDQIGRSLTAQMTASLAACHHISLKLHVLTELEMIAGVDLKADVDRKPILESLNRRIEVIGSYLNDKQYILGIRRAAMRLSR